MRIRFPWCTRLKDGQLNGFRMPRFDLADDPWVPLWSTDGARSRECSVREALTRAQDFGGLDTDIPTQVPAILRQVLLPVVAAALGRPADGQDWLRRFGQGRFSEAECARLGAYLDEHRDSFDLFSQDRPFAQVAGLRTGKGDTKSAVLMVATESSGNNVPLFSNRTEGDVLSLTPAQAARWLLHTHCWDTAAIKTGVVGDPRVKAGKTMANPTGPLGQLGVVLPVGRTLYETLLLNLPVGAGPESDVPQWHRSAGHAGFAGSPRWQVRSAAGLLDLWTWQARRVRLVPVQTPDGVRVERVIVAAGDRMAVLPDLEPHTTWNLEPKKTPPQRPRRHQPGQNGWRGMKALLAGTGGEPDGEKTASSRLLVQLRDLRTRLPTGYPLQVHLTGITYGTQSSVVDNIFCDTIPLPVAALDPSTGAYRTVLGAAERADNLAKAVNTLSADLRRAAGGDPIPWDRGQRPGDQLLHALDLPVRRLLCGVQQTGEDQATLTRGLLAWEQTAYLIAHRLADALISQTPATAFLGRTAGGRRYRQGTAERAFRIRVNTILSLAAEVRREARNGTGAGS
ncbi:type I-E CRISPR-associated protein Cse1/CasA [Embleya sp. AB8]|uniref:type I-E CRISPR-associated protein Cse1/CasA n=1 Tax=Embleya sp. AB8 TaxID=3156304 RepID=UPI003C7493EC